MKTLNPRSEMPTPAAVAVVGRLDIEILKSKIGASDDVNHRGGGGISAGATPTSRVRGPQPLITMSWRLTMRIVSS